MCNILILSNDFFDGVGLLGAVDLLNTLTTSPLLFSLLFSEYVSDVQETFSCYDFATFHARFPCCLFCPNGYYTF
jgi:hypothetical protein